MLRHKITTGSALAALVLTMVVAGTSGAVAGRMVTSADIQDRTIDSADLADDSVGRRNLAPGSVTWSNALNDATRARIAALAGADGLDGLEGETGPAGLPGTQGDQGPRGSRGPAGMGEIAFWGYFGAVTSAEWDGRETGLDLVPLSGPALVLNQPGDYLVTIRGLSSVRSGDADDPGSTAIYVGDPGLGWGSLLNACLSSGHTSGLGDILMSCDTSYSVSVQPGDTLEMPVSMLTFDHTVSCVVPDCGSVFGLARVTVYKISSTPTGDPGLGCFRESMKRQSARTPAGRC